MNSLVAPNLSTSIVSESGALHLATLPGPRRESLEIEWMSARELKALTSGQALRARRLRSGRTMASDTSEQMEKAVTRLRRELESAHAELENAQAALTGSNQLLDRTRGEVTRLEFELRTHTAEAEVDKLRAIESLRQEMDLDRRQARRERELELAQHQKWRDDLQAERAVNSGDS